MRTWRYRARAHSDKVRVFRAKRASWAGTFLFVSPGASLLAKTILFPSRGGDKQKVRAEAGLADPRPGPDARPLLASETRLSPAPAAVAAAVISGCATKEPQPRLQLPLLGDRKF